MLLSIAARIIGMFCAQLLVVIGSSEGFAQAGLEP
jgi:hypothetical protein